MASRGRFARNSSDYAERARARNRGNGRRPMNREDVEIVRSRSKRIRDVGQKPPKGYGRTGGLYFQKIENMRPIKSKTTQAQRSMVYANREHFFGVDGQSGYIRSAANQGMYDGESSELNFRKTAGARKIIDKDGGTYGPDYSRRAGAATRAKSRYIIAFGQDGHMR